VIASILIYVNDNSLARRLVAARSRLGLSQLAVARLVGTSQPNLSAYERGRLLPGHISRGRLEALCALAPDSAYARSELSTLASLSVSIRTELRTAGDDPTWPVRLTAQAIEDSRSLRADADLEVFLAAPGTTGDERWDALLAGVAEMVATERGLPVPAWALRRALAGVWFVNPNRAWAAAGFVGAPPALKSRGVLLNASNLGAA